MWPGTPPVAVYETPDRATFEQDILPAGRPALLKGLVAGWPLVRAGREGPEAFAAALLRHPAAGPVGAWFGEPAIGGRYGYDDAVAGFNHDRRTVPLADLVRYILDHGADARARSAYAGAIALPTMLPSLLPDVPMPLLDPARERLTSLWIGTRARTAAHWDVPQNIACVVAGRRRFTLMPTEQVANLYVGPIDVTPAGQPISLVDFHAPDLDRFPRFADAMAAAETATLEPGDALYVPSLWWHHVETLDPLGAMVNFWWRDAPDWAPTPLYTLFHALLTLRDLPAPERAAWRTMFDHYVFRGNGADPAAHLPEGARGVLGPLTPELRARIRDFVAGQLRG